MEVVASPRRESSQIRGTTGRECGELGERGCRDVCAVVREVPEVHDGLNPSGPEGLKRSGSIVAHDSEPAEAGHRTADMAPRLVRSRRLRQNRVHHLHDRDRLVQRH